MLNTQLSFSGENLFFVLSVVFHRFLISLSTTPRPSSAPFLSGDTFRALADHIYEVDTENFDPLQIQERDIVFVQLHTAKDFFTLVHPFITNRYILILHNGDESFDKKMVKFIDRKIIAVFSQNVTVRHPKVIPLPIGLENYCYYNHGVPSFYERAQKIRGKKRNAIVYGFSIGTNPRERQSAYNFITAHPAAERIPARLNSFRYVEELRKYKFVLSPPGNGVDCLRTWEALYLRVVPIVKRSVGMEYFAQLGLPIWIVDDWNELDAYTPQKLAAHYQKLQKKANYSALNIAYWQDRIDQYASK